MFKKPLLLALLISSVPCFAAVVTVGGNVALAPKAETVTANLASTSYTIPSNFVGFSEEEIDIVSGGVPYNSSNTSLINLIKLLGTNGEIRIGGNSQDTPNSYSSTIPAVTQTIANGVASFAAALGSGWMIDWGLDGKTNSPSTAVTHAGYFLSAFGSVSNPLVFSLDNEPDLWSGFTAAQFQTQWNSYYSALTTAYPSIKIEGIEATTTQAYNYTTSITLGNLQFYSTHTYFTGDPTPSAASVIAQAKAYNLSSIIGASSLTIPWKDNETGINYDVGKPQGVVDRLTSAVWYLNMAMNIASEGGAGINPHSVLTNAGAVASNFYLGLPSTWNVFDIATDGNYYPHPIFYGMYLMSKIEGQQVVSNTTSGTGSISALGVRNATGNSSILVTNDDVNYPVIVTPNQSTPWRTATVLVVNPHNGLGCTDPYPLMNGSSIGESGAWTGSPYTITNGESVTLSPCGSALIQVSG